jgi:DNA-binding MarR family transcriptional regulator
MTVSELADTELVSLPAISRILGALEDDGLVARERVADDRRRVQARITRKGRTLMNGARARRVERIAERLSALDPDELGLIAAATDVLERLERNESEP